MDPDRWLAARKIFEQVIARKPADQARLFRDLCAENPEMEAAVGSLLAADQATGETFGSGGVLEVLSALEERSGEQWEGTLVGAYRIVGRLGQGGMGSVFLAERADDEFRLIVALKILRLDIDSDQNRRRFLRERQLLANLEHPNIARLLDGGTTNAGLPYLVMERVQGEPITDYCDLRRFATRERVELVAVLCDAVQHAHQSLIVHRDLKASNVLVTDQGTVKLLDFGIAKLLAETDSSEYDQDTLTEARAFTPDFASPEQLLGGPITTASDVYSVGILLYQLLTGVRPFSRRNRGAVVIRKEDIDREASPPSGALDDADPATATLRDTNPGALRRQLSGDLDNIILKALRADPQHRYASAQELADDLRRYLDRRPVQARPSHWTYLAGRFVRRHVVGVVTAALVSVGIIGFSITMAVQATLITRERDRARHERDNAEIVTRLLVDAFEATSPDQAQGLSVSVLDVLSRGADRIAFDLKDQPELKASLQHTIGSIYTRLGHFGEAEPLLAAALEERRSKLGEVHPAVADSWHEWSTLLYSRGDLESAGTALEKELEIRRAAGDAATLAQALHLEGLIAGAAGRRDEKAALHERALDLQRATLGEDHRETIHGMRLLAAAQRLLGDSGAAITLGREALASQQKLHAGDHPLTATMKHDLSKALLRQEEFDEAVDLAQEALRMQERLYGDIHTSRSSTLNTLGVIEREQENFTDAEEYFRECLRIQRELVGESSYLLSSASYNLATLLHRNLGRPAEAEGYYRLAVENYRSGPGTGNSNMGYYLMGLGRVLSDLSRLDEAEALLVEALEVFRERRTGAAMSRNEASASSALAGVSIQQQRYEDAESLLLTAHPVLVEKYGADHRITLRAAKRLAELYRRLGRESEAEVFEAMLAR